jgi:hypothetical protein
LLKIEGKTWKNFVKVWDKRWSKLPNGYEMVRNFTNFKAFVMFAMKKLDVLPPRRQHFHEKFLRLGQNPRK